MLCHFHRHQAVSPCNHNKRGTAFESNRLLNGNRDRAQQVAKEEIAEMSRQVSRSEVNVDYLKAVLVDGFEAGALPASSPLFPVLARMLSFSPEDMERAKSAGGPGAKKAAAPTAGIKSGAGGLQRVGSTVRPAIGRPGSSGLVK